MTPSRNVELRYAVKLSEIALAHGKTDIWLPFPEQAPQQEVLALRTLGDVVPTLHYDPVYGNAILHFSLPAQETAECTIGYSVIVRRREWKTNFSQPMQLPWQADARLMALHLQENRKIKFLPEIIEVANSIKAQHTSNLAIARAAYEHVLSNMRYDKSGDGWGDGDTAWACSAGQGNCTDFHSLFLAIIRAAGVPGQFEIGMAFPAGMSEGDITFFKCGYHCWTSFYTPEFGWVPADVSEASLKPELREYFFGAVDQHRLVLSRGRDINLVPLQRGGPENFFTEPCIETASGKALMYEKKLEFASV